MYESLGVVIKYTRCADVYCVLCCGSNQHRGARANCLVLRVKIYIFSSLLMMDIRNFVEY